MCLPLALGIISRIKILTSLNWNLTQIHRRVPQALVMTQVMKMAPPALTIFARTTHRCPYISLFIVGARIISCVFLHITKEIWLTTPILPLTVIYLDPSHSFLWWLCDVVA